MCLFLFSLLLPFYFVIKIEERRERREKREERREKREREKREREKRERERERNLNNTRNKRRIIEIKVLICIPNISSYSYFFLLEERKRR